MQAGELGLLITPNDKRRSTHRPSFTWAADNGCFSPKNWTVERWWSWFVSERENAKNCIFATAPDRVGNADETMAQATPWLRRIRALGFPAALVAQDGVEKHRIPWDDFDVLFLGGSTAWKLSDHAFQLSHEARRRSKGVHMGRVNSGKRWRIADSFGCTSADGTFLAFGPKKNLPRLRVWTDQQPTLFSRDPQPISIEGVRP